MPKSCQRRLLFLNPSLSIRTPKFGTASGLWHAFRGFILHEALHCCNCSACRKRVAGTFSRSSGMSSRSPGYRRRRCPGIRCCKRVSRPTAYFWQAGEEMEELRRRKRKPLIETPAAAPRGFRNLSDLAQRHNLRLCYIRFDLGHLSRPFPAARGGNSRIARRGARRPGDVALRLVNGCPSVAAIQSVSGHGYANFRSKNCQCIRSIIRRSH